ncbi:MAG: hypothetical protein LKF62_05595 [Solobacterium sp.]|jgi:hypothetical protein|nr:hypothetical protein [Solobacterium sp.]
MVDLQYLLPVVFSQRFEQQLTECQGIGYFTDIQEGDDIGCGDLQAIEVTAVETDKKPDF